MIKNVFDFYGELEDFNNKSLLPTLTEKKVVSVPYIDIPIKQMRDDNLFLLNHKNIFF